MPKLLNRFGTRIAVLSMLSIEYPVGRGGTRFEASLPTAVACKFDWTKLRYYVVQDDAGARYPAMIDRVSLDPLDSERTTIRGAVVAHG